MNKADVDFPFYMCWMKDDWSAQVNLRKQDALNHTNEEHLRQLVIIVDFIHPTVGRQSYCFHVFGDSSLSKRAVTTSHINDHVLKVLHVEANYAPWSLFKGSDGTSAEYKNSVEVVFMGSRVALKVNGTEALPASHRVLLALLLAKEEVVALADEDDERERNPPALVQDGAGNPVDVIPAARAKELHNEVQALRYLRKELAASPAPADVKVIRKEPPQLRSEMRLYGVTAQFKGKWDGNGGAAKKSLRRWQLRNAKNTLINNAWDVVRHFNNDVDQSTGRLPMRPAPLAEGKTRPLGHIDRRFFMYAQYKRQATPEQMALWEDGDPSVILLPDEDRDPLTTDAKGIKSIYHVDVYRDSAGKVITSAREQPCSCNACFANCGLVDGGARAPCLNEAFRGGPAILFRSKLVAPPYVPPKAPDAESAAANMLTVNGTVPKLGENELVFLEVTSATGASQLALVTKLPGKARDRKLTHTTESGATVEFKSGDVLVEVVILHEVTTALPGNFVAAGLPADYRRFTTKDKKVFKEKVNMLSVRVSELAAEVAVDDADDDEPGAPPAPAGAPPVVRARSSFLGPVVCRADTAGMMVYYISRAKLVAAKYEI